MKGWFAHFNHLFSTSKTSRGGFLPLFSLQSSPACSFKYLPRERPWTSLNPCPPFIYRSLHHTHLCFTVTSPQHSLHPIQVLAAGHVGRSVAVVSSPSPCTLLQAEKFPYPAPSSRTMKVPLWHRVVIPVKLYE